MGLVIFNGRSSLDYGIQVEHPPGYQFPERDYEAVHIPGRNGDLVIDNGSYQNVARLYDISFGSRERDFAEMANAASEWLNSASGYARLEDSYEPEYYRMAMYKEEGEFENILEHGGRATIAFNCKPQRFLKSGEEAVAMTAPGTLRNPTGFAALPRITVHGSGSGTLGIGSYTVAISDIGTSLVIDSEIQDAYSGTANRNSYVTLSSGFPQFVSGENGITWSGGITSLEVVPRWWTL